MLLHSCPDTVHRFLLRKTQTSTSLIEGSSAKRSPQIGITPAVADCRYRAPLSPRLHGVYSIAVFKWLVNITFSKIFLLSPLGKYNIIGLAEGIKHSFIRCADTNKDGMWKK